MTFIHLITLLTIKIYILAVKIGIIITFFSSINIGLIFIVLLLRGMIMLVLLSLTY